MRPNVFNLALSACALLLSVAFILGADSTFAPARPVAAVFAAAAMALALFELAGPFLFATSFSLMNARRVRSVLAALAAFTASGAFLFFRFVSPVTFGELDFATFLLLGVAALFGATLSCGVFLIFQFLRPTFVGTSARNTANGQFNANQEEAGAFAPSK